MIGVTPIHNRQYQGGDMWWCTRKTILLLILFQSYQLQVVDPLCPVGGAMYYGPDYQMCFYVVIEPATTLPAKRAACSRHGGVLSHIPDADANAFLFSALSEMSGYTFVLGLNDIAVENVFVTSAGNPQPWINWDDHQPDNCCGGEDCCIVKATDNSLVVHDYRCTFESKKSRALCHLDISPELPTQSIGNQNDGARNAFTKLQSPAKGIVGAQLQNVSAYSQSMCALLCRHDDSCRFFTFTSTDSLCSTYAIPKIEPTADGAASQIGQGNVWVRR